MTQAVEETDDFGLGKSVFDVIFLEKVEKVFFALDIVFDLELQLVVGVAQVVVFVEGAQADGELLLVADGGQAADAGDFLEDEVALFEEVVDLAEVGGAAGDGLLPQQILGLFQAEGNVILDVADVLGDFQGHLGVAVKSPDAQGQLFLAQFEIRRFQVVIGLADGGDVGEEPL